jgi:hypothetical protein
MLEPNLLGYNIQQSPITAVAQGLNGALPNGDTVPFLLDYLNLADTCC